MLKYEDTQFLLTSRIQLLLRMNLLISMSYARISGIEVIFLLLRKRTSARELEPYGPTHSAHSASIFISIDWSGMVQTKHQLSIYMALSSVTKAASSVIKSIQLFLFSFNHPSINMLANSCIRLMSISLKQDICGLNTPGLLVRTSSLVESSISSPLRSSMHPSTGFSTSIGVVLSFTTTIMCISFCKSTFFTGSWRSGGWERFRKEFMQLLY